ncbi:MAG: DNA repair protein RecO [Desulfovibrionales bacterium]
MSSEFTQHAIIFRVGRFREADCWVRLLTPGHGILSAFAFGGSKSRRRFCGCLDSFNHVLFKIKPVRSGRYLCLQEGVLLNRFSRMRADSARTGMAVNCIKFLEQVQLGEQGAAEAFDLLLGSMNHLEEAERISSFFPLLFRAKTVCDQGYSPALHACAGCGKSLREMSFPRFSIDGGQVYCQNCSPPEGKSLRIHPEAVRFLETIVTRGPFLEHPQLSRRAQQDFYSLVDAFIEYHLGLVWEGNRFRRI